MKLFTIIIYEPQLVATTIHYMEVQKIYFHKLREIVKIKSDKWRYLCRLRDVMRRASEDV